jgi:hypothetical protein
MKAAEKGRADCVRLLLDAGDDKEATDKVCVRSAASAGSSAAFFTGIVIGLS